MATVPLPVSVSVYAGLFLSSKKTTTLPKALPVNDFPFAVADHALPPPYTFSLSVFLFATG